MGAWGEDAQLGALGQGFHVGHQVVGQEVVGGLPGDQAGPHSGGGGGQQVLYRPCWTKVPSLSRRISPAMYSTSETMWVDKITSRSSASSLMRFRKRMRSLGSRPAVGSSRMRTLGSLAWPGRCPPGASCPGQALHLLPKRTGCRPTCRSRVSVRRLAVAGRRPLEAGDVEQVVLHGEVGVKPKLLGQVAQQVPVGRAQG